MMERTLDSAAMAISDDAGRILLVRQTYGTKKWALPGGRQLEGESAWDTAIRECREEAGLEIGREDLSLTGLYFLSHRNAYVHVFKAEHRSGAPVPDGAEVDEVGFFPVEELPTPVSSFTVERIRDAARFRGKVFLKEQNISRYTVGNAE
jgi:8-oxo-dGTP pyrophosphatase MutT (NUDIX family)